LQLQAARVRSLSRDATAPIDIQTPIGIEFVIHAGSRVTPTGVSLQLINEAGTVVFDSGPPLGLVDWSAGTHRLAATIPPDLLNDGSYRVAFQFNCPSDGALELPNLLAFEVLDSGEGRDGWYGKWPGVIRPRLEWRHEAGSGD
jgi:lipopolysaccharide transport system ATP-binding protein